MPDQTYLDHVSSTLKQHGFHNDTCVNILCMCQDAICSRFKEKLKQVSPATSDVSSFAGQCFCGRTGLKIAMSSALQVNGKKKVVFWVAPHCNLVNSTEKLVPPQPSRRAPIATCSALNLIHGDLVQKRFRATLDPQDLELSLVRQRLAPWLNWSSVPSLAELTRLAYEAALADLRCLAAATLQPDRCDYAIVAGVLLHGPGDDDFFWPGKARLPLTAALRRCHDPALYPCCCAA